MPAAARVNDVTIHGGTIVGPGVTTVLLAGMPAAVVGDLHVCALPPFPSGSATVLIGGRPAVRITDVCVCGAMAAVGAPNVEIGG